MRARVIILLAVFLAAVVGSILPAPNALAGEMSIMIEPQQFSPQVITVHAGDHVIWSNHDNVDHYLTSSGPSARPVATEVTELEFHKLLSPGNEYSHTFSTSGVYAYYCAIHIGMSGTIVVEP